MSAQTPTAHYPLNNSASDVVGRNNATLLGGPIYTTGKMGQALSLDGVNDHANLDGSGVNWASILADNKDWSIALWVKPDTLNQYASLVGQRFGDTVVLGIDNGTLTAPGRVFLATDDSRGNSITSTKALRTNVWQHVAVTFEAASSRVTVYIDAVQAGSGITSDKVWVEQSNLFLGWQSRRATSGSPDSYFKGDLDEVYIFSKKLSVSEIAELVQGGGTISQPPTATLTASKTSVPQGQSTTLSWYSTNVTSCTGTNFSTNGTVSGSVSVTPTSNKVYTLTCSGAGGSVQKSITVSVSAVSSGKSYYLAPNGTNNASCTNSSPCKTMAHVSGKLAPGDTLFLNEGVYTGDHVLSARGTAQKTIAVRPASSATPEFSNALLTLSGNYIVLTDQVFNNGQVTVTGSNNRVTRVVFKNGAPGGNTSRLSAAVEVTGSYNRVDHNEVYNWKRRGLRTRPNASTKNNVFDHNHLRDFTRSSPGTNSGEALQSGLSASHTAFNTGTIFEYNLLERVNGDDEAISLKSSSNIVRYNTFKNSDAVVQNRTGTNNQWIGNTVINMDALAIYGDSHKVIANDIRGSYLTIRNGNITESAVISGSGQHPAARNAFVACNSVQTGYHIGIGMRIPGGSSVGGVPAQNTTLANNKGLVVYGQHSGTKNGSYNCSTVSAVEVNASNVGLSGSTVN